jgi:hypothetical protein
MAALTSGDDAALAAIVAQLHSHAEDVADAIVIAFGTVRLAVHWCWGIRVRAGHAGSKASNVQIA